MSGATFPVVVNSYGYVPQTPTALRAQLVAQVAAAQPGYTADLPGTLIEDIASTDVFALLICDSALGDLVNSISPYTANPFILAQLGNVYGVQQGVATYTSVYVVFTGSVGYQIPLGFVVSDGTYQYTVQDGTIIPTGGSTTPVYCLAGVAGAWAVPANTVTQLVTSVPSSVTLSVTNPTTGVPGTGTAETEESYRARVLQAGLSAAQGMPNYLRTLLGQVPGVQQRLVSIQQSSSAWKVLVGGGDPYQVANAIFQSLFDVSTLVGSSTTARNISVNINNYPDTYTVIFVGNPPELGVEIQLTWNTTSTNYVSSSAIASLGSTALVQYVNSVPIGQPMNLFELQATFQNAVSALIPSQFLTRMVFTVLVNTGGGYSPVTPTSGTGIIASDPEGYFFTNPSGTQITITQG